MVIGESVATRDTPNHVIAERRDAVLESLAKSSDPNLQTLHKRMSREPPSANIHWSDEKMERGSPSEQGRVFVHCSAGIHRTGMVVHGLMRHLGFSAEATLSLVSSFRQITADAWKKPPIAAPSIAPPKIMTLKTCLLYTSPSPRDS